MASIKEISLPHGTIPTQMFGNVNLQNAMMYVNENFAEVKSGVNDAVAAANEALDAKADADHDHDEDYAALEHTHAQSEIVGLSSALDGKAELNHEHSQYLTSLPAHYHATSEVQGLDNLLQAKAEKTHTHTIADVESLTTELGVKASTSYVDQQVNSVSTSIKTIADNEIEEYAADKDDVDDTPKDVEIAPTNETDAQKKARIGTSVEFARKDHKHVFTTETSDLTKLKHDGNGEDGAASFGSEDKVPRIDHSHPLNYPADKPVTSMAQDGMGTGGTAMFGSTNYYADLGHSHPLNVATSGTPSDCAKSTGTASSGSSQYYARQDHVHKIPALGADDISYSSTTVGGQLETNIEVLNNHESRISALEDAPTPASPVTSVNNKTGDVVLDADDVGALDSDDIGDSIQAHSSKLDSLESALDSNGKVPLSQLTGNISGHENTCYVTIDNNGTLGHSGNAAYNLLNNAANDSQGQSRNANKLITDLDVGNGIEADSSHNIAVKAGDGISVTGDGVSVKADSGKGITVSSNGVALTALTASKWMKTDASGLPSTTDDAPIVASASDTGVVYNAAGTISYKTIGTATGNVAAGDHTHAYGSASLTGFGTAAESDASDFAPSSTVSFPGFGTVAGKASEGNHTHTHSGITDWSTATSSFLTDDDIGSTVQEYSSKLDSLDGKLNSDGTLPSLAVSDANCASGGDCFAYFKSDKTLGHLGNTGVTVTKANAMADSFTFTPSSGYVTKIASLNYKAAGASAVPTTQKVIGFAANSATASLVDAATFASGTTIEGDKFVKTTSSGTLTEDDFEGLEDTESNIQDVGTTKSLGNSTKAAPSNHVHSLPTMNDWTGDQTLTNMIQWDTTHASSDGYVTMKFYPPIFDKYGRYKGLSTTAITQDLLVPWD